MQSKIKKLSFLLIGLLSFSLLAGCHKGQAERAGQKMDNKVEHVSDALQDKGPAQKAGEKADELANAS